MTRLQAACSAKFGFEITKEEILRKCIYTWQYVCSYIEAEYKYGHVWLSEKQTCISKTLHALKLPRLYRFYIKFVLFKSIQITGKNVLILD